MAHHAPFPSLRFLKQKAKQLNKAHADGEPWAERFVAKHWHASPLPTELTLAGAHRALAHSLHCRDWMRLKRHVELLTRMQRDGVETCPTTALDELVETMGLAYPFSFWAHQFVAAAGARGQAAAIRGLSHPTPRVRAAASSFLDHYVTHWDGETLAALSVAAADKAPRVRAAVLHALSCQRCKEDPLDESAVALLIESLGDESAKVRRTGAAGLWSFRHRPRVRSTFLKSLGDDNRGVRQHAAAALSCWSGDAEVVRALVTRLAAEPNARVVRALLASIRETHDHLRGSTREAIEARLGKPSFEQTIPTRPLTCYFPVTRLTDADLPTLESRYHVRLIFDAAERLSSVSTHAGSVERIVA